MNQIIIEERADDFMAYLKGNKAVWGCGPTKAAAIKDLKGAHSSRFSKTVED